MADNELAVMSAVESSNIPASKKSFIRRYYESAMSHGGRGMERAKRTLIGGAQVLRQGGESAVVGAGLGALDVELPPGLDAHVGGVSIPIDAVVAAAGLGGSVLLAHEAVSDDLRNAGASALSVFSFRQTRKYLGNRAIAKGVTPGYAVQAASAGTPAAAGVHGDFGEDPIVALARNLG